MWTIHISPNRWRNQKVFTTDAYTMACKVYGTIVPAEAAAAERVEEDEAELTAMFHNTATHHWEAKTGLLASVKKVC
jgi:hypothetical protein